MGLDVVQGAPSGLNQIRFFEFTLLPEVGQSGKRERVATQFSGIVSPSLKVNRGSEILVETALFYATPEFFDVLVGHDRLTYFRSSDNHN